MAKILIVDDEANICQMIAYALRPHGHVVETAHGGGRGIELLSEHAFDIVITDIMMPEVDGLTVLDAARQRPDPPDVVIITGFGSVPSAVEAMKRGAIEYLTKPLDIPRLIEQVDTLDRVRRNDAPPKEHEEGFKGLIGSSRAMTQLYELIEHVAHSPSTVLISGESGTGKELVARAIHLSGPRADGPFIAVDCGALTESLLESELFGHVKGAFTGAVVDKTGLFEAAHKGTIFLDEVGELPPQTQQKLLRCIQERAVRPIGNVQHRKVDVRIIAATHRDLAQMVEEKLFRSDLFYRLDVIPVPVPSLAERSDDIPVLAEFFAAKFARRLHRRAPKISDTVMTMLVKAEWAGNVRQLENVIECAVTFCEGDTIRPEHLSKDFVESFALSRTRPLTADTPPPEPARAGDVTPLGAAIRYLESQMLSRALDASDGNKEQAATMLGIDRATLYRKLKSHGLGK